MTPVFAPVLIRGKIESYEYIFHLQSHCKLIERLIEYSEFYLGDDSSPSPSPSPRPTLASVFGSSSSSGLGSSSSSSSSSSLISSQPDSAESFDETEAIEEDQSEDEELFIPEDNSVCLFSSLLFSSLLFSIFSSRASLPFSIFSHAALCSLLPTSPTSGKRKTFRFSRA